MVKKSNQAETTAPEKPSVDVQGAAGRRMRKVTSFLGKHVPMVWSTVASGFALTVPLFSWVYYSLDLSLEKGLGLAFYFTTLLFFLGVGLLRMLKETTLVPTLYRLFHYLGSAILQYVCFVELYPRLSIVLESGAKKSGYSDGSTDWSKIVISFFLFTVLYFIVIGLRALVQSVRKNRQVQESQYQDQIRSLKKRSSPETEYKEWIRAQKNKKKK